MPRRTFSLQLARPQGRVHQQALGAAFKGVRIHKGPDCAYCIHSKYEKQGAVWDFICKLKRLVSAAACPDFKDTRNPRFIPHALPES